MLSFFIIVVICFAVLCCVCIIRAVLCVRMVLWFGTERPHTALRRTPLHLDTSACRIRFRCTASSREQQILYHLSCIGMGDVRSSCPLYAGHVATECLCGEKRAAHANGTAQLPSLARNFIALTGQLVFVEILRCCGPERLNSEV
jgi:hypothetical protein